MYYKKFWGLSFNIDNIFNFVIRFISKKFKSGCETLLAIYLSLSHVTVKVSILYSLKTVSKQIAGGETIILL